jgi:type IV pilus assembly protein PilN
MAIRFPINLATEPFRRDRPILVASIALAIVLALTLAVQSTVILRTRQESAGVQKTIDVLQAQVNRLNAQQAQLDGRLRQPQNAEVLERSLLLNELIQRKAISWTRIFSDLEKVVPWNVRLVSVRLPQIDTRNHVLLDMIVGADEPGSVLELFKRLEASPQFGPTSVLSSSPPSQTDKLWKYRVSVSYAQKL